MHFFTVDASLIGLSAVLFQLNEDNKMKVISYNPIILNHKNKNFVHLTVIQFNEDNKMKVISYNPIILNHKNKNFLHLTVIYAVLITHYISMHFSSIQYIYLQITKHFYIVLQRKV